MENAASLFAAIATTLAAMMTAANLGPRVTGWGFVVFTLGAIGWLIVAAVTGQTNLLWQNGILLVIDVVGIWRWLGREARYESGAEAAEAKSRAVANAPALFPVSRLNGCPLTGPDGQTIARSVDAMAEEGTGRIAYIVVSEGGVAGVAETLHALDWHQIRIVEGAATTALDAATIAALPPIAPDHWPATRPAA